jgi:hypothetical protein
VAQVRMVPSTIARAVALQQTPRYISDRFLHVLSLERLLSGAFPYVTLMSLPLPTSPVGLRARSSPREVPPRPAWRLARVESIDSGRASSLTRADATRPRPLAGRVRARRTSLALMFGC